MKKYQKLLRYVLRNGEKRKDRTGIGTLSVFNRSLTFDLQEGFPAVTTKKLYFNSVAAELAGFLQGVTSAADMRRLGTKIWDANANAPVWQESPYCQGPDDMGKIYGAKWRDFHGVDQLVNVYMQMLTNPSDRRMVITAWDPSEKHQCLPPCHIFWQVYLRKNTFLDLIFYMRSCDLFLGLPFDIASYALLTHLFAQTLSPAVKPGKLTVHIGDAHIYLNHIDQVKQQLLRRPYTLPLLRLNKTASLFNFYPEFARLHNYKHHEPIPAKMAV